MPNGNQTVDIEALAKKYGGTLEADLDALAKKHGGSAVEVRPDREKEALAARPDPNKQAQERLRSLIKSLIRGTGTVDPTGGALERAQAGKEPKYSEYMKESGKLAGATAGAMALGPVASAAAGPVGGAEALPWIIRLLARSSSAGFGAGGGSLALGASPKEALGTAATATALEPAAEGVFGVFRKPFAKPRIEEYSLGLKPRAAVSTPALNVTNREVLEHAAKEGIDLTPYQATKKPIHGLIQAIGERSALGATKLSEQMEASAGKFNEAITRLEERVDPKAMGTSPEAAGEAIKQSAETAKSVAHENASNAYKQLPQFSVNTTRISAAWRTLRGGMPMGMEENILAQVPRNMRSLVEEILKPTGMKAPMTSEQAITLRSLFRELGDSTPNLPTRVQGIFKQMSEATDGALERGALKVGVKDQWRAANAGWKEYVKTYGDPQSPAYKILREQDPKRITDQILSRKSARDVEILRQQGIEGALDAVKRRVVNDIAQSNFRITKNGLSGYSDGFLKTLFGKDLTQELYVKGEIARRFKWQMNPSGTSNVLMGEHQLLHPEKAVLPMGGARYSRPRSPLKFMRPRGPRLAVPVSGMFGEGEKTTAVP
jgi:hypothetical protein